MNVESTLFDQLPTNNVYFYVFIQPADRRFTITRSTKHVKTLYIANLDVSKLDPMRLYLDSFNFSSNNKVGTLSLDYVCEDNYKITDFTLVADATYELFSEYNTQLLARRNIKLIYIPSVTF